MRVIVALPPNFEQIAAVFPQIRGNDRVIFCWDDAIYAPGGEGVLTPELRAHEGVHYSRQHGDPQAWWDRYLADIEFRIAEEIPAHRAEYRQFCSAHRDSNQRVRFLHALGARLSGPLYGSLLRAADARRRIVADR